jgi:hypothetical protein
MLVRTAHLRFCAQHLYRSTRARAFSSCAACSTIGSNFQCVHSATRMYAPTRGATIHEAEPIYGDCVPETCHSVESRRSTRRMNRV